MTPYTDTDLEHDIRTAIDAGDTALILSLGAMMDARDAERPKPTLHASALWYAEHGLNVFPLQPGAKIPFKGSAGCKDATTDREQIDAWWSATPAANIGIATGHLIDVIDVDGPDGVASIGPMLEKLPTIYGRVSTPRPGGTHLYVAAVPGRGNRARLLPGVDYRGAGGYVVAPPSVNSDGVAYVWHAPLDVSALAGSEVAA